MEEKKTYVANRYKSSGNETDFYPYMKRYYAYKDKQGDVIIGFVIFTKEILK